MTLLSPEHASAAIYLWIGFSHERGTQPWPHAVDGFMGVTDSVCVAAGWCVEYEEMRTNAGDPFTDGAGPYNYEVLEEIGAWIFKNWGAFDKDGFTAALDLHTRRWEGQGTALEALQHPKREAEEREDDHNHQV